MLRKIFFKEEMKEKSHPGWEFGYAMEFVKQTLEYEKTNEDRIIVLNFISELIKEDLKTNLLTTIFYNKEPLEKEITLPFPFYFEDGFGRQASLSTEGGNTKEVDLTNDCVIVLAWDRDRMRNSIKNIFRNPFQFSSTNHLAYYYSYVDICYAYNGTHSISAGIVHRKGSILAKVVDIRPLFDHIYTDGVYWYNQHNHSKICELWDFRIGVIFEISKIKFKLEKNT